MFLLHSFRYAFFGSWGLCEITFFAGDFGCFLPKLHPYSVIHPEAKQAGGVAHTYGYLEVAGGAEERHNLAFVNVFVGVADFVDVVARGAEDDPEWPLLPDHAEQRLVNIGEHIFVAIYIHHMAFDEVVGSDGAQRYPADELVALVAGLPQGFAFGDVLRDFDKKIESRKGEGVGILVGVNFDHFFGRVVKHKREDAIVGADKVVAVVPGRNMRHFDGGVGGNINNVDGILRESGKAVFEHKSAAVEVEGGDDMRNINDDSTGDACQYLPLCQTCIMIFNSPVGE